MKPVYNNRTTPFDIGDIIISKFSQRPHYVTKFKIVELSICQTTGDPCCTCHTGNIAYTVKRFKKRLGLHTFTFCPLRNGVNDYYKYEPLER